MNTAKAQKFLLDRLGTAGTVLLSVHLALPGIPAWCDGKDAGGRAVCLVGKHSLGDSPEAAEIIRTVLASLAAGNVPDGVLAVAYAPAASRLIAEIVASDSTEVLGDGPRGSGKTQAVPAALAILAELHARAGLPLPLRVLWLHDSMVNAAIKTGRSLEQPMWGGLWSLRDDRRMAVLTIGGNEMVTADFVGTRDETAAERLRAEAHVLAAEELVASLDDSGGIEERKLELGLTSLRLPTRRRVAMSTTNPGDEECWPYRRYVQGGGRPGCVRVQVPASDRLAPEEIAALRAAFRDSPDLEKRLALGEWAALIVGEVVAVGFRRELHVAPRRLEVVPGAPLVMGHDAGLTPVTIIGQAVGGEVRILAALASDRAGTRQHLENLVLPWLATHAPFARRMSALTHYYDQAMETPDESSVESSPLRVLREVLGGATLPGPVSWPGRRDPLLMLLARLNPTTGRAVLQVCPEECRLLISALAGRWHYPNVNGRTSRELPAKDHPWSDLGDSLCYALAGGLAPGRPKRHRPIPPRNVCNVNPLALTTPVGATGRDLLDPLQDFFTPRRR
jgi:hypothetical protein